jgi:hypothetical protein
MLATKTAVKDKQKTIELDSEMISILEKLKKTRPDLQGLNYLEILKQMAFSNYNQSLASFQKKQSEPNSTEYVEMLTEEESVGIGISKDEIRRGKSKVYNSSEELIADILNNKL